MPSLLSILEKRPRRTLQAVAASHHLPFNTWQAKTEELARLHSLLSDSHKLKRALQTLSQAELAALQALQAQGGSLPQAEFTAAFGAIRPYRPWREGSPEKPWKHPISAAERLWFLAFIDAQGEIVSIPDEVLAELPTLPRPDHLSPPLETGFSPDSLLADLTALLGVLLQGEGRVQHNRWLAPTKLGEINQRLLHPDELSGVRSELQTTRLRFLHYLAETAGLLSVHNRRLVLAPVAWAWLDDMPGSRWQTLWAAWEGDLRRDERLWQVYRFPKISERMWSALFDTLASLPHNRGVSIPSLLLALRPFISGEGRIRTKLITLLRGPLTQAGLVSFDGGTASLTLAGRAVATGELPMLDEPATASLIVEGDYLRVVLPPISHPRPFVEALAWAGGAGREFMIGVDEVRRAASQGLSADEMARVLSGLVGKPLPLAAYERLHKWHCQAGRLRLERMWVLSSPDTSLLADLRGRRRLAPAFDGALSSHHLVVKPQHAKSLPARLNRRGLPPIVAASIGSGTGVGEPFSQSTAAYLWLAVNTYRRLSRFLSLPVGIPTGVVEDIAAHLNAGEIYELRQMCDDLMDALAQAVAGLPTRPAPAGEYPPATMQVMEAACRQQRPITISYLDAAGQTSHRTIEPVMIFEQSGAWYVEAWCRLAEDVRTFRADRVTGIDPEA